MIYLIGLQNPGVSFKNTRHNIGGDFLEYLYKKNNIVKSWEKEKNLYHSIINFHDSEITLILPLTFMNKSGEIFWFFKNKNREEFKNIYILSDDMETDFSKIKLKTHENKSHKGHNGLKSIKEHFSVLPNIIALGIGRPESRDKEIIGNYVLSKFTAIEQSTISSIFEESTILLKKVV